MVRQTESHSHSLTLWLRFPSLKERCFDLFSWFSLSIGNRWHKTVKKRHKFHSYQILFFWETIRYQLVRWINCSWHWNCSYQYYKKILNQICRQSQTKSNCEMKSHACVPKRLPTSGRQYSMQECLQAEEPTHHWQALRRAGTGHKSLGLFLL